ncbi:hypothetical protein ACIBI9_31505 [Nonomuraea sp. NPDC050451]|uniref:hypothetical protein n=1 Tax=Nonomuraea sp. NPDC050451 TaxID=3364364 RepID=UPI0037B60305
MTDKDWAGWHDAYDVPGSPLERRLQVVRKRIAAALDSGAERVVSLCAGQGRDLLPVLAAHPRRDRVRARLVELDEHNVAAAGRAAPPGVEVVRGDAALLGAYAGAVPADLVLVCGGFERVEVEGDDGYGVGVHRYAGPPVALDPGARMFTFV